MTMVWPRCLSVADASARIATSVVPPAGHGTTKVTGREGKFCACAAPPNDAAKSTAAAKDLIIALPSGRPILREAVSFKSAPIRERAQYRFDQNCGWGTASGRR